MNFDGRRCALVFAASARAPAFEAQARVIDEQADELEEENILVGYLMDEGESRIGSERIERDEARALRSRFGVGDADFRIVLLNDEGDVVRSDDAPLQGTAILRALNDLAS